MQLEVQGLGDARRQSDDRIIAGGARISLEQCVVTFLAFDVLILAVLGLAPTALGAQFGVLPAYIVGEQGTVIALTIGLFLLMARVANVYGVRRILDKQNSIKLQAITLLATFSILLFIGAATKTSQFYSRLWFFSWAVSACLLAPAVRLAGIYVAQKRLRNGDFVFRAISAAMFCEPLSATEITRRTDGQTRTDHVLRLNSFDELDHLSDTISRDEIDQVYFTTPWDDAPALLQRLRLFRRFSAEIFVLPDDYRIHTNQLGVSTIGDRLALKAVDRPLIGWDLWRKRALDVAFSALILVMLAPVLCLIAAAIKWESRGPVLFRQRRAGLNGRTFELLKFRSMYDEDRDADATRQTGQRDSRVTRVGRFIRATSLDELPQFLNVLQGAMSVVGPRPHALKTRAEGRALEEVADQYAARHRVKPGLTGWAQINGLRGELDSIEKVRKRVQFDIDYIEHWSTWLDVKIILRTMPLICGDRTAY